VYVAQRPLEQVLQEDILADNNPLLPLIHAEVERDKSRVRATFFGLAQREALYREGLGCAIDGVALDRAATTAPPAAALPVVVDDARLQPLIAAVKQAFSEPDATKLRRTRAVVILRDGQILAQRYAAGFSAETPQIGWSMSKSVTAMLAGIRIAQGALSIDRDHLLPEWQDDARASVTLDHLLRMSSGLEFDEAYGNPRSDVVRMIYEATDPARYAAAKPLLASPGTAFKYSSGTTQILSRVLRNSFAGNERAYQDFPRSALFAPLGMQHATFELDQSGTFSGASFLYASAHDWARLGLLLLNDGVWQGKPILPPGWVRYMRAPAPAATKRNYGAHVWLKIGPPYNSLAATPPVLPADAFHLVGHDAQFVTVIPSLKLVVIRLGLSRKRHSWDHETFLASIIAALPP
jgi:CubicO group peptidase (beta-lactamase class C family)